MHGNFSRRTIATATGLLFLALSAASPARAAGSGAPVFQLTSGLTGGYNLEAIADGVVLFFEQDYSVPIPHPTNLWRSDGTAGGTVEIATVGYVEPQEPQIAASRSGRRRIAWNGKLFFTALDASHGKELWVSDGTAAGTGLVADLQPGPIGSDPGEFAAAPDAVYFTADDGVHGRELWRSDGTLLGTKLVDDIQPGAGGSAPAEIVPLRGAIFFSADDGSSGRELWRSDGTEEGTERVADIRPGPSGSDPIWLTAWNGRLYFSADDGAVGRELWRSNGTGARLLDNIAYDTTEDDDGNPLPPELVKLHSSEPNRLVPLPDELAFLATQLGTDRDDSPDFFVTGGTPGDSQRLSLEAENGYGWALRIGDAMLSTGDKYPGGFRVYRDHTISSVSLPHDFVPDDVPLEVLAKDDKHLFLGVKLPATGYEPWVSAGTQESTYLISDIVPGPTSSLVEEALPSGGLLFLATFTELVAIPRQVLCDTGVCGVDEGRCWGDHPTQGLHAKWKSVSAGARLDLMGEVALPPADANALDPLMTGVRVTIDAGGAHLIDAVLPGGYRGGGATRGWTHDIHGRSWNYLDRSANPPGGIRRLTLRLVEAGQGVVRFHLRLASPALPSSTELDLLLDLDGTTQISNRCAAGSFASR
jgi:ELWxxDGT repeat protein